MYKFTAVFFDEAGEIVAEETVKADNMFVAEQKAVQLMQEFDAENYILG